MSGSAHDGHAGENTVAFAAHDEPQSLASTAVNSMSGARDSPRVHAHRQVVETGPRVEERHVQERQSSGGVDSDFDSARATGDEANDDDAASVTSLDAESVYAPSLKSLESRHWAALFEEENGRTYNTAKDKNYILPNDPVEQDRLDLQHECWKRTHDENLCLCPKERGARRVLDVGTGTGIWAIAYADAHPSAQVLGVDMSPIQPDFIPPNCSFEMDDVEQDWLWTEPFDFIHVRHMNGCLDSWPKLFKQAFKQLERGGYIELHDNAFPILCPDDTMPETSAIARWSSLLMEGTNRIGRPIDAPARFKEMLEDAGFEGVVEKKRIWATSPWPADHRLRSLSRWVQAGSVAGLEASTLALFTRVLGWTPQAVKEFCEEVKAELLHTDVHAYWEVYCVYGRKPMWAG